MATLATFSLPAEEYPLGALFEDDPETVIELDRIVPTDQGLVPYFWVQSAVETGDIRRTLEANPAIERVEIVDSVAGRSLVRVEWRTDASGLLDAIAECDVALLSGVCRSSGCSFEIRADRHEILARFQRRCLDDGLTVTLRNLQSVSEVTVGTEFNLTRSQREALVLAYERGYFRSPREVTLADLGSELGITGQSVGSRIRRGVHRLVGNTVAAVDSGAE